VPSENKQKEVNMPGATFPYNSVNFPTSLKQEQNLALWLRGGYKYFVVNFIEGIPEDQRTMQDLGAIAANGQTNLTQITVANMNDNEIGEFRFRPLDDVALEAYLPNAQGRFVINAALSRVSLFTGVSDRDWAITTVVVYGNDRSLSLVAYNPTDYAIPKARVQFWGYRYILSQEIEDQQRIQQMKAQGLTYMNAEGLSAGPSYVRSGSSIAGRR
jgi:hypothetical protein